MRKVINVNNSFPIVGYVIIILAVCSVIFALMTYAELSWSSRCYAMTIASTLVCLPHFFKKQRSLNSIRRIIIENNLLTIEFCNNTYKVFAFSNILEFNTQIYLRESCINTGYGYRKIDTTVTNFHITIKLKKSNKIFEHEEDVPTGFFLSSYNFVFQLMKCAQDIPNFTIDLFGNGENKNYGLGALQYYYEHGTKRPFWLNPYFLALPLLVRIILVLAISFSIIFIIVGLRPILADNIKIWNNTSTNERKFLNFYKQAIYAKELDKNCVLALSEFNKAEKMYQPSRIKIMQKYNLQFHHDMLHLIHEREKERERASKPSISNRRALCKLFIISCGRRTR